MRKSVGLLSEFASALERPSTRRALVPLKNASLDLGDLVMDTPVVDPQQSVYETQLEEEEKEDEEKEGKNVAAPLPEVNQPRSSLSIAHEKKMQERRRSVASTILQFDVTKINQRGRKLEKTKKKKKSSKKKTTDRIVFFVYRLLELRTCAAE
jgi:hypothetical protein